MLPFCFAFAALVEFGQLYFPGRTCAGSDVWAQGLGATVGILAWVFYGQWVTDRIRSSFEQSDQQGNPAADEVKWLSITRPRYLLAPRLQQFDGLEIYRR